MKKLVFTSNLGHRVEHMVSTIGENTYQTKSVSRLQLIVKHGSVYLSAGWSELRSAGRLTWAVAKLPHHYRPPICLGRLWAIQDIEPVRRAA